MKRNATRRLLTALLAAAMCLSLAACGSKPAANGSADTDAPSGDNAAKKYTIGVCQLVTHDALDAATQGFIDAVQEKLCLLYTSPSPRDGLQRGHLRPERRQ